MTTLMSMERAALMYCNMFCMSDERARKLCDFYLDSFRRHEDKSHEPYNYYSVPVQDLLFIRKIYVRYANEIKLGECDELDYKQYRHRLHLAKLAIDDALKLKGYVLIKPHLARGQSQ